MWRLFRAPRLFKAPGSLISSPRTVFRFPLTQKQTVPAQRLRFSRRFRMRNVLIGTVAIYAGWHAYSTVVLSPLVQWLEAEEERMSASERKALDDAVRADSFFPLPLTTRAVQPPPYSGNDPEWLEYVKISQNKPLQQQIRDGLAQKVRGAAESSRLLTMRVGKNMKVNRRWLDIDYPYRPPVIYRRLGILVTNDAISLAEKSVDPAIVNRTDRILWPVPMFLSTVALVSTLVQLGVQDLKTTLGYELKSPPALPTPTGLPGASPLPASQHHPDIQKALARIQQQATKRPEDVKDPRAMSQNQDGAASSHGPFTSPSGQDQDKSKPGTGKSAESAIAFRNKWMRSFKRKPEVPPRGSIAVSGLVELETSKSAGEFGCANIRTLPWFALVVAALVYGCSVGFAGMTATNWQIFLCFHDFNEDTMRSYTLAGFLVLC